jgi:hypothetical protein
MHKNATKCNKTQSKWCINKHKASKIIDTFETYQRPRWPAYSGRMEEGRGGQRPSAGWRRAAVAGGGMEVGRGGQWRDVGGPRWPAADDRMEEGHGGRRPAAGWRRAAAAGWASCPGLSSRYSFSYCLLFVWTLDLIGWRHEICFDVSKRRSLIFVSFSFLLVSVQVPDCICMNPSESVPQSKKN